MVLRLDNSAQMSHVARKMTGYLHREEPRISPEAQYREEYEAWRQHDRFIWQTPSIVVVVDGVIIATSFAFQVPWWAREVIIGFALILTLVLTFALFKHRYFIDLEQETLLELERTHAEKCIQRMTEPEKGTEYWHKEEKPAWLQKQSAHRLFRWGMYGASWLMLTLLVLNWLNNVWVSPYAEGFVWVAYSAVVVVAALLLWKNRAF